MGQSFICIILNHPDANKTNLRVFTLALNILFLISALSANTPVAKLIFSNPQEGAGISFVVNSSAAAEAYTELANMGKPDCRYIPSGKYGYFRVDDALNHISPIITSKDMALIISNIQLQSTVKILDTSGRILLESVLNSIEMPTNLRNAIYLIQVINKQGIYNQKTVL